jgi:membrane protease YdiL (CAAX protease family)
MRSFISRYPVLTFTFLTLTYQFAVVGVIWAMLEPGQKIHDDRTAHMIFRFRVFGPLVFAVMITLYLEGSRGFKKLFASFIHWRVPAKWYLLAFSWKFIFTYVGIATLVALGLRQWPGFIVPNMFGGTWENMGHLVSNLPFIIGIAFVEETAWMKFSVTRLQQKYSALTSCVLVGVSWGLWYLPMLLLGDGVPDGYTWPMFMTSMLCLTILLGWTYNMTRSGTILLIMQVVSNCAFFIVPVLPAHWGLDDAYVNAFVGANLMSAILLVVFYGPKHLGTRVRAKWSDEDEVATGTEPVVAPVKGNTV